MLAATKHMDAPPALGVSSDGRGLVSRDGSPFFWLADTAWEMIHKLSREETRFYLRDRASRDFSVIQTVVLAEMDGLRTPNFYGDLPLREEDPEKPVEAYFTHIDWVLREAGQLGLYIALLPTWGDKVECRYGWARGPEIFNRDNAYTYGRFLGTRYSRQTNLVWVLGGDRDPGDRAVEIWRSMAMGIRDGAGPDDAPLMTFHPQPFDGGSSSRWFHGDEWLSFNMLQTGHDRDTPVYQRIRADYERLPVKPVLDGEPVYEAHGIAFKPMELGYSTDTDVRKSAWWSVFSGACGHTYGCHSIWQFLREGEEGVNFPIYTWRVALDLAGASQMRWLRRLMSSEDPANRAPAQELLLDNAEPGPDYATALRERSGRYAWIYSPAGRPFRLRGEALAGEAWLYRWMSPRDGCYTVWTWLEREDFPAFRPPSRGYGCDWVLIINDEKM